MSESNKYSLITEFRQAIKDGIDYFQSSAALVQAQFTNLALSSVVFIILMLVATVLGLSAFVFFNIALGYWLTDVLGSAGKSILILGSFYGVLALICGWFGLRWLKTLQS